MSIAIRRWSVFWIAAALLLGAALVAVSSGWLGGGQAQAAPQAGVRAQVELVVANTAGLSLGEMGLVVSNIGSSGEDGVRGTGGGGTFQVDSFFDISYAISGSGLDGLTASSFNVDSFFDIEYRIEPTSTGGRWETEMISMSLTGTFPSSMNPGDVLDEIRAEIRESKSGDIVWGHVTVLK